MNNLRLEEYNYNLPQHLIAQTPLVNRDEARLMVINRKTKKIVHDYFGNITQYLPKKSVVVLNNSKVIPARLFGHKERSGGKVEIFLLKKLADGRSFEVLMRPLKKIKEGDIIFFNGSTVKAQVVDIDARIIKFNKTDVMKYLGQIGHVPLPPYIRRQDNALDQEFYQTVYARHAGSVAAPTAGLHFTKPLLNNLEEEGHKIEKVTLHVNYGTFKPVEEDDITKHKMHYEQYSLSQRAVDVIKRAKAKGQRIISVGTTSCRVLEAVAAAGKLRGRTNLFIYPGYKFQTVDTLITNFHFPYSSLLMLVYAFGSKELIQKAYKAAIKKEYRFYSYGDAMLIK